MGVALLFFTGKLNYLQIFCLLRLLSESLLMNFVRSGYADLTKFINSDSDNNLNSFVWPVFYNSSSYYRH